MTFAALRAIHVLSVIVWIGGMVFVSFFLRPALAQLDPPARLRLMNEVLGRFFWAVLVTSLATLISGVLMFVDAPGGSVQMPWSWTVMALLGAAMVTIFLYVRFALYPKLSRAVLAADWAGGGGAMTQIRQWVTVNLALGIVTLLVVLLA